MAGAEVNKPNLLNQIPLTVTLFRLVEEPASFENKKICFLIAELLVKNGADLDWIIDKKNGYTLLHYFCSFKIKMNKTQKMLNLEIIRFLLDRGANSKLVTLNDTTCRDLVESHCSREEILEILEAHEKK